MAWDIDSLFGHFTELRKTDKEAIDKALGAAEKAVNIAETNAERWRNSANEWRGAMTDRERDFLGRKEFYAIIGTAVAVFSYLGLT